MAEVAARLSLFLCQADPVEAARVLEGLSIEQSGDLVESLSPAEAAGVLSAIDPGRGRDCLAYTSRERAAEVLSAMTATAAARLLRHWDRSDREGLIGKMSADAGRAVRHMLDHPGGSAGALMDPAVISFPETTPCREALRRVLRLRQQVRYYVYVTDEGHKLTGVLTIRDLIQAPASHPLVSLARRPVARLHVRDGRSVVLNHPGWRAYHSLPVVDASGVLVGALRYETWRTLEAEDLRGRAPSMLAVGTTLGQAWIALSTTLLDGLAASFQLSRTGDAADAKRSGDDH